MLAALATQSTLDACACDEESRHGAALALLAAHFLDPAPGRQERARPGHNKAARRRLCADCRRPCGQHFAYERTIPVAVAAKVVGVEMVDFTESPPFEIDGTPESHDKSRR
jgi:hypothetical protein